MSPIAFEPDDRVNVAAVLVAVQSLHCEKDDCAPRQAGDIVNPFK
jgi:hypothetical protein